MSKDILADLLIVARSAYHRAPILALDKAIQDEECRKLNAYGILSLNAIGSILDMSPYRVNKAVEGQEKPKARGNLNPKHLTILGIGLGNGYLSTEMLNYMVDNGTSPATIHDLTLINESIIYRKTNRG